MHNVEQAASLADCKEGAELPQRGAARLADLPGDNTSQMS